MNKNKGNNKSPHLKSQHAAQKPQKAMWFVQYRHNYTAFIIHVSQMHAHTHLHTGVHTHRIPVGQLSDVKCHPWHQMWVNSLLGSGWALSTACCFVLKPKWPRVPHLHLRLPHLPPPTGTDWIPFPAGDKAEIVTRAPNHYDPTNVQHTVRVGPVAFKLCQTAIKTVGKFFDLMNIKHLKWIPEIFVTLMAALLPALSWLRSF